MSELAGANPQTINFLLRGWNAAVELLGASHVLVGVAMFINGPLSLGPVFDRSNSIPWWVWGGWAVVSGTLVLLNRTRLVGLGLAAGWFVVWAALLSFGLIEARGPYYAIPVYLLLASLHLLVFVVEAQVFRTNRRTVR